MHASMAPPCNVPATPLHITMGFGQIPSPGLASKAMSHQCAHITIEVLNAWIRQVLYNTGMDERGGAP